MARDWTVTQMIADQEGTLVQKVPFETPKGPPMAKFEVIMLEDQTGRDDDAFTSKLYRAGEQHQVGAGLYRAFVEELKVAKPVKAAAAAEPGESRSRKTVGPSATKK